MKRNLTSFLAVALAFSVVIPCLHADDKAQPKKASATETKRLAKKSTKKEDAKTVEMFQAMDEGLLTVDYIGKDATEANLIFRNKADQPLNIVLPPTFGAVPVLGQMMGGGPGMGGGGMGMGGMGGGGMGGGGMGGGQGMGGGMGGGGMGGGGMGMGGMGGGGMGMGGMMRLDNDRPQKMTVPTLCLNHGKADPNPRMKYKVVRLSEVNDSPIIEELCKAVANGKVSQNTAQAAAWHVANGLTWEELLHKPRVISEYTGVEMFFSKFEVEAAMRLTAQAAVDAEKNASYKTANEPAKTEQESIGEKLAK